MATPEQISFVMTVLKHTEMKSDWNAVAVEAGISLPGNAQRKFREFVTKAGFKYTNGQVVDGDGPVTNGADGGTGTKAKDPSTPKTKGTKRKSPAKKEVNGDGIEAKGSKKTKLKQPVVEVDKEGKQEVKNEDEDLHEAADELA